MSILIHLPALLALMLVAGHEPPSQDTPAVSEAHAWNSLTTYLDVTERQYLLMWNPTPTGLAQLDQFMATYPQSPHLESARYLKAVGLWGLYRYDEAAAAYAAYLEHDPNPQRAILAMTRRVQSLIRDDQMDAAMTVIQAYQDQPGADQRQLPKVDVLALTGHIDAARDLLDSMIAAAEKATGRQRVLSMLEGRRAQLAMVGLPVRSFSIRPWGSDQVLTPETFRGRVLLLDFWASWCRPCVAQMPHLVTLVGKLDADAFAVLGISLDERSAAMESVTRRLEMTWPQFFDGLKWKNAMAVTFDVHRLPELMLVDQKGIVRQVGVPPAALDRLVAELLQACTGTTLSQDAAAESAR